MLTGRKYVSTITARDTRADGAWSGPEVVLSRACHAHNAREENMGETNPQCRTLPGEFLILNRWHSTCLCHHASTWHKDCGWKGVGPLVNDLPTVAKVCAICLVRNDPKFADQVLAGE